MYISEIDLSKIPTPPAVTEIVSHLKSAGIKTTEVVTTRFGYKLVFVRLTKKITQEAILAAIASHPQMNKSVETKFFPRRAVLNVLGSKE